MAKVHTIKPNVINECKPNQVFALIFVSLRIVISVFISHLKVIGFLILCLIVFTSFICRNLFYFKIILSVFNFNIVFLFWQPVGFLLNLIFILNFRFLLWFMLCPIFDFEFCFRFEFFLARLFS